MSNVLDACFEHSHNHDANLLWRNARIVALDFYKRLGLQTIGPEFDIKGIGPHFVTWKVITS